MPDDRPAFLFDLDGTLVDSVYQHVLAWQEALAAARRARALGVGVLSGGYGRDELERAGAYRVYQDPADLLSHLDEVGLRTID
jgi:phosphoglycolate phosphatase-like HAD superfamily hydrolase